MSTNMNLRKNEANRLTARPANFRVFARISAPTPIFSTFDLFATTTQWAAIVGTSS